jgi:hypothetical protein
LPPPTGRPQRQPWLVAAPQHPPAAKPGMGGCGVATLLALLLLVPTLIVIAAYVRMRNEGDEQRRRYNDCLALSTTEAPPEVIGQNTGGSSDVARVLQILCG